MPDLAMSRIAMADSLCYPLILFALYAMHRALGEGGRPRDAILAAALSALCYMAKPGYLAIGVAFLGVLAVRWIRERGERAMLNTISAILTLVMLVCLARVLGAYVLKIDYAHASVYQKQMSGFSVERVLKSLNGAILYLFFLPAALLIYPVVVPVAHARALTPTDRSFLWVVALSVLMVALGTAYVIYIDEYAGVPLGARVHLRYFAAFAPAFFALCLSPSLRGQKGNAALAALLAWMLAGTIVLLPGGLLSGRGYPVDALLLSAATNDTALTDPKAILKMLLIGLIALGGFAIWKGGWQGRVKRGMFALLAVVMIVNNVSGYDLMRHNGEPERAADAREAAGITDGASTLFVAGDGEYFWPSAAAFDARVRDTLPVVELGDLIAHTGAGGTYEEFIPQDYWTTDASRLIARPRYLVLDSALLYRVVPASGIAQTATQNGYYAILYLGDGTPWIHSALSGFASGCPTESSKLTVFDAALCAGKSITIQLKVTSPNAGDTLAAGYGERGQSFSLTKGTQWIKFTIETPGDGEPIAVSINSPDGTPAFTVDSYLVGAE